MAITFQFTLNDLDAENFMYFIHEAVNSCHKGIIEEMGGENRQAVIDWYKNHIQYIEDMKKVILKNQTRVEDSKEFEV